MSIYGPTSQKSKREVARTIRQQYDKINQSIFNNSFRSVLLCGTSPHTKCRTLASALEAPIAVFSSYAKRDSATATRTQDKKLRSTFGSRNRRLCGRLKDPKFPPENAERKCQVVDPNRQAWESG